MPKIVMEHEDVGAWKMVNSTFLRQRLYSFKPGRRRRPLDVDEHHANASQSPQAGPGQELPHQEGLVFFTPQDVKEMNDNPAHPHGAKIEDILDPIELKQAVTLITDAQYTSVEHPDRRRGIMFQLGTYPGEDPDGAHVDFHSVELKFVRDEREPMILPRGEFFWINVVDSSVGPLPMNPFHASYFFPGHYFAGPAVNAFREHVAKSWVWGERYLRGKTLHSRLRLDPVARPPQKSTLDGEQVPQEPAKGAVVTYWNGLEDFSVSIEHQRSRLKGAPTYLRYVFTLPEEIDVTVYGWPSVDLLGSGQPTNAEVSSLVNQEPAHRFPDKAKKLPRVEEIRFKSSTWTGRWTHGGPHDPPPEKP